MTARRPEAAFCSFGMFSLCFLGSGYTGLHIGQHSPESTLETGAFIVCKLTLIMLVFQSWRYILGPSSRCQRLRNQHTQPRASAGRLAFWCCWAKGLAKAAAAIGLQPASVRPAETGFRPWLRDRFLYGALVRGFMEGLTYGGSGFMLTSGTRADSKL